MNTARAVPGRFCPARRVRSKELETMAGERELPERIAALEEWSDGVQAIVEQLLATIDHMHDDLVALREWARIPRPACYRAIEDDSEQPVG